MTPAQQIAFANPCRLPEQCGHPRFRRILTSGTSLVLTLESGFA
jgi:hypothetical protein